MSTRASCLAVLASVGSVTPAILAQGIQYPPDANVVNVLAFGAIPNDNLPDTAAFQAALNATVGSNRILYIPNGIYNFDDRLDWGSINTGKALQLQGQSQSGVILRLNPASPGFQNNWDSSDPDSIANEQKPFIDAYEGNTANAFENYLNDLTIEVGPGNPGAIALQFQSNNTGAIRNVTLRATAPNREGAVGLDVAFNFPGPFLAKDLTIEGFDEGVRGAPQEYSVTFENLTLLHQRVRGMGFWRLPIQIRNLVSVNTVPVLQNFANPGAWGHIVIDGASLTGGSAANDAIINEDGSGVIVLRNVITQGYRFAVNDQETTTGPVTLPDGLVAQHTTDIPQSINPSPTAMLPLFAEETPAVPTFPISQWASVKTFGAVENDNLDDTDAIIAALNSGAPVVYFPTGTYRVSRTLDLPPTLHRLEGLNSSFALNAPLATENAALFRIAPGAQPTVFISGCNASFSGPGPFNGVFIEHAAANTLVLRDGACEGYRNTVAGGRVFIENIVGSRFVFTGQRVFARQFNPEGSISPHIINDAGDFYVLGLKTEGNPTVLESRNRARSLVLGGLIYPSTTIPDRTRPMFVSNESSFSFSVPESCYIADGNYAVWVRETRNAATADFTRAALTPSRGHAPCGGMLALYNAYAADPSPPSTPGTPALTASTLRTISIAWTPAADAQSGIARYNILRDGAFLASSTSITFTDTELPDGSQFSYSVIAVNGAGLTSTPSAAAPASTLADEQAPRVTVARAGLDPRSLRVEFSEPLAANAANPANYTIAGPAPVTVTAAVLSDDRRSVTLTTTPMSAGTHSLSIAGVTDRASSPNPIATDNLAAFAFNPTSAGTGLTANYFLNRDFIGSPALTRIEGPIDFPYGTGSPAPGIPADNFAVRWSGQLQPRFNETYTLFVRSDDGTRLLIDGRLIINNWADQGPTERSATIALDSSRTHDIVVEYYENSGGAIAQLSWQSPSQPKQIIPASALFPASRLTTVRTTQGAGADTTLERLSSADNGSATSMGAFHSPASGGFHDAAYFRFDLAPLDLANNTPAEAVVTLSQTFFGIGSGIRDINFFHVRQSTNGDHWVETGPGFVTWDTAAGLDQSGGLADPAAARFVSTFRLDNTGFQNNNQPDKAAFSGQRLLDALADDTDNRLTFIGKRVDPSNEGQSWFTKEWGLPSFAPALKVRLIPNCPEITTQPLAPAGNLAGRAVVLFAAAQGKPPLTYQWLRNGEPIADGPGPLGGSYAGADSPALTIEGFTCEPGAVYQLQVSNACGSTISNPATLSPCPADLDCSGDIDLLDFFTFFGCYDAGDPCADVDGLPGVDLADFFTFFGFFDAGC